MFTACLSGRAPPFRRARTPPCPTSPSPHSRAAITRIERTSLYDARPRSLHPIGAIPRRRRLRASQSSARTAPGARQGAREAANRNPKRLTSWGFVDFPRIPLMFFSHRKRGTGNRASATERSADVAQLVAHHLAKVRVAGSSPVIRSTTPPDHHDPAGVFLCLGTVIRCRRPSSTAKPATALIMRWRVRREAGAGLRARVPPQSGH